MANFVPIHQMIRTPDIVGNFQRGMQLGQEQRQQRIQEEERQQLRNLAPKIMQGDPSAFTQAATISPEAANTYQDSGDRNYRRVTNVAKLMREAINTNNPQAKQHAFSQIRPFLSELAGGRPVPETWDDSLLPGFEQFEARVQQAQAVPQEIPSGFQQFQMTAQAAGLVPGSPEYQQAARIALGQEGRAASGGYSFEMIRGADGRERPARRDPRDGSVEVFTGDNWAPLGGPATVGAPIGTSSLGMPTFAAADGSPVALSPDLDPNLRAQILQNPGSFAAVPDQGSAQLPPTQTPSSGAGGLAVGRSPEEQAAAEASARRQVELSTLPGELSMRTQAAIDQAGGTEAARIAAEQRATKLASLPQTVAAADQTIELLDKILTHPGKGAATGVSSLNPLNRVPGTDAYNFNVLLDQIKGQAFLQAFQSLKGGGAITEREGLAATNAIARLNAAQSESEFAAAINDLRRIVSDGRQRAIQSASQGDSSQPSPGSAPRVRRFNPTTGRLE